MTAVIAAAAVLAVPGGEASAKGEFADRSVTRTTADGWKVTLVKANERVRILLPRDLLERIPMDWWVPPKDGLPGPATPGPDGTRIPLPIDPDLGDDIADRIGDIVTWLLNILNQNGAPDGDTDPPKIPGAPLESDALNELMERLGDLADQAQEVVRGILEELVKNRDLDPADVPEGLEEAIRNLHRATTWGSKVHKALEDLVREWAARIEQSLGEGFRVYPEQSVPKGAPPPTDDDGMIIWSEHGEKDTLRPDVIITQVVDGAESLLLIIDLKTGNAGISKAWIKNLQKSFDMPDELLGRFFEELRPTLPRPKNVLEENVLWL